MPMTKPAPVRSVGGAIRIGANAQPVDDGRRCDHCNVAVVVPTRLRLAKRTGADDAH